LPHAISPHPSSLSSRPPDHRHPHSFPTRRSSDLVESYRLAAEALAATAVTAHPESLVGGCDQSTRGKEPCIAAFLSSFAPRAFRDRKSTRLNSSHLGISYAVFCLKKKKQ